MRLPFTSLILTLALAGILCPVTRAVVVEVQVSPQYMKQAPGTFTIDAKQGPEGLIHFTITHSLREDRYIVATLTVRNERKVVAQFHVPSFVRERTITCYASLDPDYLAHSSLEIAERTFAASDKTHLVPLPGGIDYQIRLQDFAKTSEGK